MSLIVPVGYSNIASTMVRMLGMTIPFYNCFETAMWSGSILHDTMGSVSFFQRLSSSKVMSISMFVLIFNIVSMRIVDTILKFIMSMILNETNI